MNRLTTDWGDKEENEDGKDDDDDDEEEEEENEPSYMMTPSTKRY